MQSPGWAGGRFTDGEIQCVEPQTEVGDIHKPSPQVLNIPSRLEMQWAF